MKRLRRVVGTVSGLLATLLVAGAADARAPWAFPGGTPITLLVPYAVGGTTAAGARLLAARLEEVPSQAKSAELTIATDAKEGIRAFVEKRSPRYEDR